MLVHACVARPDLAFQTNVGAPSKSGVGMGEYNYNYCYNNGIAAMTKARRM